MQETPVNKPLRIAPSYWNLENINVNHQPGREGRWTTDGDAPRQATTRSQAWLLCKLIGHCTH